MSAQNESAPRRSMASVVVGGSVGAVVGFVVGFAAAGGLWLWAFARGLAGAAFSIPGLVTVGADGDMTTAEIGPLLLASPFIVSAVIAGIAVLVLALRRPRTLHPALP